MKREVGNREKNMEIGIKSLIGIAIAVGVGFYGYKSVENYEHKSAQKTANEIAYYCRNPESIVRELVPLTDGDYETVVYFKKNVAASRANFHFDDHQWIIFNRAIDDILSTLPTGKKVDGVRNNAINACKDYLREQSE
jgi:hypothetical protein